MGTTHKRLMGFLLTATVCAQVFHPARPAFSAWLEGVREIKIRGETHAVYPKEELIRRGFPIREVPDEDNAAIEYLEALSLYVEPPAEFNDLIDYVQLNIWIEEAEALIPWFEENRAAIVAVRRGVRKLDCQFPWLCSQDGSLLPDLLSHLRSMRDLGKLLVVRGKYFESKGDYRAALDTYMMVGKTAYHVSRDVLLISGLVGLALDGMSAQAIEKCILRTRLDPSVLDHLQQKMGAVGRSSENYDISVSGERAFDLVWVDDLFEMPVEVRRMLTDSRGFPKPRELLLLARRNVLGLRAMLKAEVRRSSEIMDKWNSLPGHLAFRPENLPDQRLEDQAPLWRLAGLPGSSLNAVRVSFARVKAFRAILTAELALEVYWNQNRRYPKTLGQLKGILDKIPLDPFTNEPINYRRTWNGYVLYSVGHDLVDNGGNEGTTRWEPDTIARYPLPEPEPFK